MGGPPRGPKMGGPGIFLRFPRGLSGPKNFSQAGKIFPGAKFLWNEGGHPRGLRHFCVQIFLVFDWGCGGGGPLPGAWGENGAVWGRGERPQGGKKKNGLGQGGGGGKAPAKKGREGGFCVGGFFVFGVFLGRFFRGLIFELLASGREPTFRPRERRRDSKGRGKKRGGGMKKKKKKTGRARGQKTSWGGGGRGRPFFKGNGIFSGRGKGKPGGASFLGPSF